MSTKPETTYYTGVNKHLPRALHREKMNNPYRSGTADFWYSGHKGDLWAEYKWLKKAPKSDFEVDLTPLQHKWLRERCEEGRSVVVIIGCPTGSMVLQNMAWVGQVAPRFELTRQQVAQFIEGKTYAQNEDSGDGRTSYVTHVQAGNSKPVTDARVVDSVPRRKTAQRREGKIQKRTGSS